MLLVLSAAAALKTGQAQEERVENRVPEAVVESHEEAAEQFLAGSGLVLIVMAIGLAGGRVGRVARVLGTAGAVALVLGGYWLGTGGWRFAVTSKPIAGTTAVAEEPTSAGKVLYWKDPDGRADFSPAPKKTPDGRDYLPVL